MKFTVCGEVTVSIHTIVEAANPAAARRIAAKREMMTLGGAYAECAEEEWCVDSIDGEPEITDVVLD